MKTHAIAGPAGSLHVDDGGRNGLAVLFVHSFAGSSAHWQAQLAHLRESRRALAMDLRGHGASAAPEDHDYAIPHLADDVAAVADALDLSRFVLVGHSMGGSAAAAYAGAHPSRLAGLVLMGTPGKAPRELADSVMGALHANYDETMAKYWESLTEAAKPSVRALLQTDMHQAGRSASLAMISATFEFDPLPALRTYAGPTLLIDTPHGDGPASLYKQMPQLERVLIDDTSHWPQLDDPDAVERVLDAFLARVEEGV